jgi:hypothetical protein
MSLAILDRDDANPVITARLWRSVLEGSLLAPKRGAEVGYQRLALSLRKLAEDHLSGSPIVSLAAKTGGGAPGERHTKVPVEGGEGRLREAVENVALVAGCAT